ncbi:MAG: hypothetical protein GQE15_15970 [Archangiaceae bacterium]|nr:hypothetical protein [Archangiaceae bacterium]
MSNDPKKPLDPAPEQTPDILQRDLNLDRRNRQAPSFEELKTQTAGPQAAMTQPGIPGPFLARPPPAAPPRTKTPSTPGTVTPGNPAREPTHFELAATTQTPQRAMAQARPPLQVTAAPANAPPAPQVTRSPVQQIPPGLQARAQAPAPAPQQARPAPPPPRAAAAPVPLPGAAPAARPPPPRAPAPQAAPVAARPPNAHPAAPPMTRTAALPARPLPPAAPRQAPPSPTDWAAARPTAPEPIIDAPTIPVQPVKLTAANPMQGATAPSGHTQRPSYAPAHVPVATPSPATDAPEEFTTTPNRPAVPRQQVQPAFSELPQRMPSHLVVTQPGIPGPYAERRDTPVVSTKEETNAPAPPPGPTRVLDQHQPAPMPAVTPDFGEVPAFEAPESEPAESEEEALQGDVLATPASLWRRSFAWVFDLIVIGVVVGGFFAAALAVIGKPSPSLLLKVALPGLGVVGFVAFVYTTLFAFLWRGRTPGRRLLGIHLVDASGHAPHAGRALVRAALSLASFVLFLSGFWLALFDRRGQTLHDKLTSTFVVRLKAAV